MKINMKKRSIWLPAIAAGAALCAGNAVLAQDTLTHVLGADNLETIYATVMPDGTIVLSHTAPAKPAESTAEADESTEATTEKHPEI
jgi:hypothetical protein